NNAACTDTCFGYVKTGYLSVACADVTPPAATLDLKASSATTSSIALTWTVPGDDGTNGKATSYDIRYATAAITAANWSSATPVTGEPAPVAAGSGVTQTMTVTGLSPTTIYFFAMKAMDEVPNTSGLSNVASATTLSGGTTACCSASEGGTCTATCPSGTSVT